MKLVISIETNEKKLTAEKETANSVKAIFDAETMTEDILRVLNGKEVRYNTQVTQVVV